MLQRSPMDPKGLSDNYERKPELLEKSDEAM